MDLTSSPIRLALGLFVLALTACQTPGLEDETPLDDGLRLRVARIQLAIDEQFREAYGMPDGHDRTQRVGALSHAQGRLSAAETMAVGASVTRDPVARLRAEHELSQLETALGIAPGPTAAPR